jgi:hypothetical protein
MPLLDDVDAGRHLGHAVLDLDARVISRKKYSPSCSRPSIVPAPT